MMNIEKILSGISPLWGICGYDEIRDNLIECRAKSRLPQNARSVIVVCFPYLLPEESYKNSNLSKYAVVTDYHSVALGRLNKACETLRDIFPDEEFCAFSDNSPIPEVRAACLAGLGVRGMNSLLITEKYGSYVFIGEIVTTLGFETKNAELRDCAGCGRCLEACPAKALGKNGVDSEKCLSAITQKKGSLSEAEEKLMLECGCVWGCDICQDICPMNRNAAFTQIEEFLRSPIPVLTAQTDIDGRAYEWRGRKVIDRNLAVFGK